MSGIHTPKDGLVETARHAPFGLLLAGAFVVVVLALVSHAKADPDLWGHIRFGQDILSSGSVARTPSYSFTADRPWVNHEWLAEATMATVYRVGSGGLVALLAAVAAATFVVVARVVQCAGARGPTAVGLVAVAMLGASLQLMTIRPQMFSLLLLALLLAVLTAAQHRRVVLLAIPVLFALWANLHGGWIVGLGVVGVWAAAAAWHGGIRPWQAAAAVAGAALGSLCNPYGHGLWAFLLETVRIGRADIAEWQAIWEEPLQLAPWTLSLAVLAYGLFRLRRDWWRTLPAVALALLSLKVARLQGLFALTTVMVVAPAFRGVGQPFRRSVPSRTDVLLVAALCVAGVGAALYSASRTAACLPLMTEREFGTPEAEAVLFMKQHGLGGDLLTWFDYGQYAIWHLAPRVRVSYDGRRETVYSERVQQAHQAFYAGDWGYARRLGADYVWLPRRLPVVQSLLDAGWVTIFRGSRSVVLAPAGRSYAQPAPFAGPRCFPGP